MQKILVTGSNGLLGQKIIQQILLTETAELIATSRGENRYPVKEGYLYKEMDIVNRQQVNDVISEVKPDVLIHTAAITNVDVCAENPALCRKINIEAVKYLLNVCKSNNIHFIYLSTDFVFDGTAGPYAENATPNPLCVYGQSKLDAEKMVQASGCRWTIIRTILVYGVLKDLSRSNIVLWARSALEKGEPLNVVTDQWRMPTLAEDLAYCCLSAAERGAEGIYNVSGKDMMSIIEIVRQVADYWNLDKTLIRPVTSASLNQSAKRPERTGFILDKAIRDLGYEPHNFREGLRIVDDQLKELL